jgi:NADPH:quinone reductase-like Zn-dependent oxidoreductase
MRILKGRRVYVTSKPGVGTFVRQFFNPFFGGKVFGIITTGVGDELGRIRELIAAGKLKPVIDKVYPFTEVAAAQVYSKAGRAKGKIVLEL